MGLDKCEVRVREISFEVVVEVFVWYYWYVNYGNDMIGFDLDNSVGLGLVGFGRW